MIQKKLVFHIYAYDSEYYFDNIAYKLHMKCLSYYSHIFDKACFNISTTNIYNKLLTDRIKHDIINCGFKDIEIIVTENNLYCEVNTFKHFILNNLGNDDSIIFFGHTKGITNVIDGVNYVDNILHWIFTMYYMNLDDEYIHFSLKSLVQSVGGAQKTFCGTLRTYLRDYSMSFYAGTFYWINPMKLYEDNRQGKVTIPKIYNRNYCEELPTMYRDENNIYHGLGSFDSKGVENYYLYNDNPWDEIAEYLTSGKSEEYIKLYNKFIEEIK